MMMKSLCYFGIISACGEALSTDMCCANLSLLNHQGQPLDISSQCPISFNSLDSNSLLSPMDLGELHYSNQSTVFTFNVGSFGGIADPNRSARTSLSIDSNIVTFEMLGNESTSILSTRLLGGERSTVKSQLPPRKITRNRGATSLQGRNPSTNPRRFNSKTSTALVAVNPVTDASDSNDILDLVSIGEFCTAVIFGIKGRQWLKDNQVLKSQPASRTIGNPIPGKYNSYTGIYAGAAAVAILSL
ncbi:MAG: hypothetical protein LBJ92_02025 [Holosporales bacterium]|nr:hypothetical protein [Holosporales bacterium]